MNSSSQFEFIEVNLEASIAIKVPSHQCGAPIWILDEGIAPRALGSRVEPRWIDRPLSQPPQSRGDVRPVGGFMGQTFSCLGVRDEAFGVQDSLTPSPHHLIPVKG